MKPEAKAESSGLEVVSSKLGESEDHFAMLINYAEILDRVKYLLK